MTNDRLPTRFVFEYLAQRGYRVWLQGPASYQDAAAARDEFSAAPIFNVRRDEIAPLAAATLVGFYALIVLTPQNVGERSGLLIGIVHIGM